MRTFIFITTKVEGFHCYPDAPDEVDYLRQMHRHMFGIRVTLEVFHDDRELEFIMVKHHVDNFVNKEMKCHPTISCEEIARKIMFELRSKYGHERLVQVTVDEDGENGAMVILEENEI